MDNANNSFHDRIYELYEEERDKDHRIGRKRFAEICGVTRGQMNGWLNRNGEPNLETLKKLAANRRVSASWLIGETNIRQISGIGIVENMPREALKELRIFLDYLKFKYEL